MCHETDYDSVLINATKEQPTETDDIEVEVEYGMCIYSYTSE